MSTPLSRTTILNHGVVSLLNIMGSDQDILDTARISYSTNKEKAHTPAEDRALMRYLVRHRHTSPLEQVEVRFYLKVPIFVARQLVRHRTANLNEVSGRYSELPEEYYVPEIQHLGAQSDDNKQGRAAVEEYDGVRLAKAQQSIRLQGHEAFEVYDSLLTVSGVSREISRIVLPLSTFTEIVWKCDLNNFFHFMRLRLDAHAQEEIRIMAQAMYDAVRPHFPLAIEAFEDYILYSQTLSRMDQRLLAQVLTGEPLTEELAIREGLSKREYREFSAWYERILASIY